MIKSKTLKQFQKELDNNLRIVDKWLLTRRLVADIKDLLLQFDYTFEDMIEQNRGKNLSEARMMMMYYLSKKGYHPDLIGEAFRRHRKQVYHAVETIEGWAKYDRKFRERLAA